MRNINNKINEDSLYGLFKKEKPRDKSKIVSCQATATNDNQCKVYYDGKGVYSNAKFRNGDIIEVCPTRPISKNSLYTRDVRDMAMEVEPGLMFVIPFGYCQHYNIVDRQHPEANCYYEWDGARNVIVIRANCTIPKNSVLILDTGK